MDKVFVSILNMSIASCIVIAAVMLIRLIFRKAPKAFFCVLWAFVGLRLICPLTLHSPFSLVPDTQSIIEDAFYQETTSIKTVQQDKIDDTEETLKPENKEHSGLPVQSWTEVIRNNTEDQKHDEQTERDAPAKSETTEQETPSDVIIQTKADNESNRFILMLPYIWIAGTALMFVFALVRYFLLSRKLKDTKADEKGIYYSKKVTTPFIIGIISPKIYLPDGTTESDKEYILAHEFAHLHRLDHLWKPIGFAILCMHWFNPLVWLAFHFFCKDIELACDERVVSDYSLEKRKEYSYALVNCSSQKKAFNYLPLGFGESSVKERVVSVLSYKKPAFWVIIVCVFAAAGISVFLMTNPLSSNSPGKSEDNKNIPILDVQNDKTDNAVSQNANDDNASYFLSLDMVKTIIIDSKTAASESGKTRREYIIEKLDEIVKKRRGSEDSGLIYSLSGGTEEGFIRVSKLDNDSAYIKYDNTTNNTTNEETLLVPTRDNSCGLTIEDVKKIISDSEKAAAEARITKGRYILDEIEKVQSMKGLPFSNDGKQSDDKDNYCFIVDSNTEDSMAVVSFSYLGDVSKDHLIMYYRTLDNKNCTIKKELLFETAAKSDEPMTLEQAKQIIEDSKIEAPAAGISRSQYIIDEFDKIQDPVISNDNGNTDVAYELKSDVTGVREYIIYFGGNKDEVKLIYNKYVPEEGWTVSGEILFDYLKDELT